MQKVTNIISMKWIVYPIDVLGILTIIVMITQLFILGRPIEMLQGVLIKIEAWTWTKTVSQQQKKGRSKAITVIIPKRQKKAIVKDLETPFVQSRL